MPIEFKCPECGNEYKTKDENLGKKMRCKNDECGAVVEIQPVGKEEVPSAAVEDESPAPPKVKDDKPRAKGDMGKFAALGKSDRKEFKASGRLAKMATRRAGKGASAKAKIAASMKKDKVATDREKVKSSTEGQSKKTIEKITKKKFPIALIVILFCGLAIIAGILYGLFGGKPPEIPPDRPELSIEDDGRTAVFWVKLNDNDPFEIKIDGASYWVQGYTDVKVGDFVRYVSKVKLGEKGEDKITGYYEEMVIEVIEPSEGGNGNGGSNNGGNGNGGGDAPENGTQDIPVAAAVKQVVVLKAEYVFEDVDGEWRLNKKSDTFYRMPEKVSPRLGIDRIFGVRSKTEDEKDILLPLFIPTEQPVTETIKLSIGGEEIELSAVKLSVVDRNEKNRAPDYWYFSEEIPIKHLVRTLMVRKVPHPRLPRKTIDKYITNEVVMYLLGDGTLPKTWSGEAGPGSLSSEDLIKYLQAIQEKPHELWEGGDTE